MNHRYLSYIICICALTACQSIEVCVRPSSHTMQLFAKMEASENTKVSLYQTEYSKYFPCWENTDSLAVFCYEKSKPEPFQYVRESDDGRAVFEGTMSSEFEFLVALYPYCPSVSFAANEILLELPAEQSFRDNSFSKNSFPMLAVSRDYNLDFKNLCAIIKLSITGSGMVNRITIESDNGFLSGPAKVELDYHEAPSLQMMENGSHSVTLNCYGVMLDKTEPKDFYIVVPPAKYSSLKISIDTFSSIITKSINKDLVFSRSQISPVQPISVDADMVDLENLPNTQIWYKTENAKVYEGELEGYFNSQIISHTYSGEYGTIVFNGPVEEIASDAFRGRGGYLISELYLPNSVQRIARSALPIHLSQFKVPDSLIAMGGENLNNVYSLSGNLVASDNRSAIKDGELIAVALAGLEDYSTPHTVSRVNMRAFSGTQIKTITLSEGTEYLNEDSDDCSISGCPQLERIYFPNSIRSIPEFTYSHYGMHNFQGFYGSSYCTTEDHMCLIDPRTHLLRSLLADKTVEYYALRDDIAGTSAPFFDFSNKWENLKRLRVPDSFSIHPSTTFNSQIFEGFEGNCVSEDGRCIIINGSLEYMYGAGLRKYTYPEGLVTIGWMKYGDDIETLTVSEGAIELVAPFYGLSKLRTVYLPTTIQALGGGIFATNDNLESVYLPVNTPPVFNTAGKIYTVPNMVIYVPEESLDKYLSAPGWAVFWDQLRGYHFDKTGPTEPYHSSDFSQDGKVVLLQQANEGNGIDLVLMGDAYSDRMIEDGSYLRVMESTMNAFFSQEPYKSHRHLFNVYCVIVVSPEDDNYSKNILNLPLATAYNLITSQMNLLDNGNGIRRYASYAIPEDRLLEATVIVVTNIKGLGPRDGRAGTCFMSLRSDSPNCNYGSGLGMALISSNLIAPLVHHEAGGHGFAKLDDEYTNRATNDDPIPSYEIESKRQMYEQYGWYKNTDFTTDPSQVRWSKFLFDYRYAPEMLGIYEGAGAYYKYGIYRPSENSIMNDNYGGYNAPSREAIYYRIHKLAYGPDWEYNYEDFVAWDLGHNNVRLTAPRRNPEITESQVSSASKHYEVREPLPVPKDINKGWTVITMP